MEVGQRRAGDGNAGCRKYGVIQRVDAVGYLRKLTFLLTCL